jgi:hypothetical protein
MFSQSFSYIPPDEHWYTVAKWATGAYLYIDFNQYS